MNLIKKEIERYSVIKINKYDTLILFNYSYMNIMSIQDI